MGESMLWVGLAGLFLIASGFMVYFLACNKKACVGAVSVLLLFSAAGYWQWGGWLLWQQTARYLETQQRTRAFLARYPTPEALIARLKKHLAQKPDARGWYLLGRLYVGLGKTKEARAAFEEAARLKPY